jgi:hypothetical protein
MLVKLVRFRRTKVACFLSHEESRSNMCVTHTYIKHDCNCGTVRGRSGRGRGKENDKR